MSFGFGDKAVGRGRLDASGHQHSDWDGQGIRDIYEPPVGVPSPHYAFKLLHVDCDFQSI